MQPDEYLSWIEVEAARFTETVAGGDLATPVPACPDWDLGALAAHLGGIHRWSRQKATSSPDRDRTPVPSTQPQLSAWLREGSRALVDSLRAMDPDQECATLAPPSTVRFWLRRQAHETAMHRWDAQAALGTPVPIDAELAADGIGEVAEMFFPRQVRMGRTPALTRSLGVEPVGGPSFVLAGDGTYAQQLAEAVVTGPPEAILLLLYRRVTLDDPRLSVRGDEGAVMTVLGADLTP